MSRQPNSSRRLERRDQRQARQISSTPRARRNRPAPRSSGGGRRGGFLSNVSGTALVVIGGAALLLALLAYVIWQSGETGSSEAAWQKAQADSDPALPGKYIPPHPGEDGTPLTSDDREHFANGRVVPICTEQQVQQNQISNPLCYASNPPTSGPHAVSPVRFAVLDNPAPKENLIHSMEHGGVVVWYNTSNQAVIDELKAVVEDELQRRRLVVMTQYTEMEPDTIALTAWTRLDKFSASEFTKKRVQDFIEEHNKRFNPEGF